MPTVVAFAAAEPAVCPVAKLVRMLSPTTAMMIATTKAMIDPVSNVIFPFFVGFINFSPPYSGTGVPSRDLFVEVESLFV